MTKNIALLSILIFQLFSSASFAQEKHKCSAKERYNYSKYSRVDKGIKSTSDYNVSYYKLDLAIENNSTAISGSGSILASTLTSLSVFEFELHKNYIIDSITVNGTKQPFLHNASGVVTVNLISQLPINTLFRADIYYNGTAPSGGTAAIGDGFSTGTSGSWGNSVTWSLSEPYAAYEWFPVKQSLTDKADSSEVWITTSATNMAGSNGVLENITTLPSGKKRFEWKSQYEIAYYLISIAVAEYVDYTIYAKPKGLNDSVKVVNFIYNNPNTLPYFKADIDETVDMLEVFSEKFGIYPFYKEKYGHCMAPFSGGMEHQTMTSQGFFYRDLTSHELGHQWFGDYITCASWSDIWINEGFASYSEYIYIQESDPTDGPAWLADTENSALNSPTGSVYVTDTANVSRIFNSSLTYNKGALLLHMLRFEINNDSLFYAGLREYSNQYSFSNATGEDFKVVMENITGMSFLTFFDQWYYGEGYPRFDVNWNQDKFGNLDMIIEQTVTASPVTPLFLTHLELTVTRFNMSDTTMRLYIDKNTNELIIPNVTGVISGITVDPNNWVLNGAGVVLKNPNLDLGIKSSDANNSYLIFPNPVENDVTVSVPNYIENLGITIYDANGRSVKRLTNLTGASVKINLSEYPSGAYIIEINDVNGVTRQPIIIER